MRDRPSVSRPPGYCCSWLPFESCRLPNINCRLPMGYPPVGLAPAAAVDMIPLGRNIGPGTPDSDGKFAHNPETLTSGLGPSATCHAIFGQPPTERCTGILCLLP